MERRMKTSLVGTIFGISCLTAFVPAGHAANGAFDPAAQPALSAAAPEPALSAAAPEPASQPQAPFPGPEKSFDPTPAASEQPASSISANGPTALTNSGAIATAQRDLDRVNALYRAEAASAGDVAQAQAALAEANANAATAGNQPQAAFQDRYALVTIREQALDRAITAYQLGAASAEQVDRAVGSLEMALGELQHRGPEVRSPGEAPLTGNRVPVALPANEAPVLVPGAPPVNEAPRERP